MGKLVVFVFSGKRKSGKDYVADKLYHLIGHDRCALIRLSGPLKYQYALENNLNYDLLLSSTGYKEQYRDKMIKWGEEKRICNPNYFCDLACASGKGKSVWLITDARRPTDIDYFQKLDADVFLVRIEASEEVRTSRGWTFVPGIDDCDSECALDCGIDWDYVISNNGNSITSALNKLEHLAQSN